MRFRFRAPLATNPRMENLFESASFSRVAKHYMAKPFSIQLLIDRKNRAPKFASNLSFNLQIKIDKLMRGLIRVESLAPGRISRRHSQNWSCLWKFRQ
jgi:hypothetical protein